MAGNQILHISVKILLFFSLNGTRRSYSSSPESAAGQVLTLADLTPAGSEPNLPTKGRRGTPLIGSSQPLRSSYPDLRSGSTHLSPREQEVHDICPFYMIIRCMFMLFFFLSLQSKLVFITFSFHCLQSN